MQAQSGSKKQKAGRSRRYPHNGRFGHAATNRRHGRPLFHGEQGAQLYRGAGGTSNAPDAQASPGVPTWLDWFNAASIDGGDVERLIRPYDIALSAHRACHFFCPKARLTHPGVVAFRDWLREEARRLDLPDAG